MNIKRVTKAELEYHVHCMNAFYRTDTLNWELRMDYHSGACRVIKWHKLGGGCSNVSPIGTKREVCIWLVGAREALALLGDARGSKL